MMAINGSLGTILIRAVFAGWLFALMVWLLPVAERSRVVIITIITYLVGLADLSHVIAGSAETAIRRRSGACAVEGLCGLPAPPTPRQYYRGRSPRRRLEPRLGVWHARGRIGLGHYCDRAALKGLTGWKRLAILSGLFVALKQWDPKDK
jgi:hypothetical protein